MKKETLQIFQYNLLNIPLFVCVCVLRKKTKYRMCHVDYKMYMD